MKCDEDPNCSGFECGDSINYCSWWGLRKCVSQHEKTWNDKAYKTCTKIEEVDKSGNH